MESSVMLGSISFFYTTALRRLVAPCAAKKRGYKNAATLWL